MLDALYIHDYIYDCLLNAPAKHTDVHEDATYVFI